MNIFPATIEYRKKVSTGSNNLLVSSPNWNLGKTPKMNIEPIVNNVLFPTIKNSKSS